MSMVAPSTVLDEGKLGAALEAIAASAAERDRACDPPFPEAAIAHLRDAGALEVNATPGPERPPASGELALVRAVAAADGSVGRIFDGHLNAVERLAVQAPADVRERELAAVHRGDLLAGVWGGNPRPGEGPPATVGPDETLSGVKTFCSGAGGLQRALVLARDPACTEPVAVWIDVTDAHAVRVDRRWYRSAGLRASASHRVVFDDAPIIARFGGPGSLAQFPWLSRDALRTAASWAGMADRACRSALGELAARPVSGPLEDLAAGRMATASETITAWLERAAAAMDAVALDLPHLAVHARVAIADGCRTILSEAARACGSHPFATGTDLDRARRDLDLFLLQHRLDASVAEVGAELLSELRRPA